MLKGKTVIFGVTGSIAAYKIANLASMLVKLHCNVHVIMPLFLVLPEALPPTKLQILPVCLSSSTVTSTSS